MTKLDNISVFKDTESLVQTNERLKKSIQQSIYNQKLILEDDVLESVNRDKYDDVCNVVVSDKRTYEAASFYKGMKVAVHNFASSTTPGGGVVKGANAQEECLCRCSTLYFAINVKEMWDGFYGPHRQSRDPLHNGDIIYTPSITVFKTDTREPIRMNENDWYDVDVITCAAPNLREVPSNPYNQSDGDKSIKISDEQLLSIHEKRLRRILDVAVLEGDEVVILGAFGCGAFENDPSVVALASKNVIEEYRHAFKVIEFAVYCSPRDVRNLEVFKEVIGR